MFAFGVGPWFVVSVVWCHRSVLGGREGLDRGCQQSLVLVDLDYGTSQISQVGSGRRRSRVDVIHVPIHQFFLEVRETRLTYILAACTSGEIGWIKGRGPSKSPSALCMAATRCAVEQWFCYQIQFKVTRVPALSRHALRLQCNARYTQINRLGNLLQSSKICPTSLRERQDGQQRASRLQPMHRISFAIVHHRARPRARLLRLRRRQRCNNRLRRRLVRSRFLCLNLPRTDHHRDTNRRDAIDDQEQIYFKKHVSTFSTSGYSSSHAGPGGMMAGFGGNWLTYSFAVPFELIV